MVRKIYMYNSPILKTVCEEVKPEEFNDELAQLINDMKETMIKYKGIGLAAPQVGVGKRVIVVLDVTKKEQEIITLINPIVVYCSKETDKLVEGCLSFPKFRKAVVRPRDIIVKGLNLNQEKVTYTYSGLLARIFLHEIDHLNGISKIGFKK